MNQSRFLTKVRKFQMEFNRNSYLMNRVKNHSVLHAGCTDYPITNERIKSNNLLHSYLTKAASHLVGIDNSIDGINTLKENGFSNVVLMDAENITLQEKFDFVVAGDVLEHMNNPGKFLEKVTGLLNPQGRLIVGVPNAFSFNIFKLVVSGKEPTHKDHTYYFSVKTLTELCSRYDLIPVKLIFTVQPIENSQKLSNLAYSKIRNFLIKLNKKLAPSFIMEFMAGKDVDRSNYFEWK